MKKLVISVLSQLGTFASLIGLLLTIDSQINTYTGWQWLLLFIGSLLFIISVWIVIDEYIENKPIIFTKKIEIRNYMYNWINGNGITLIFTRDLSWVDDDEMRQMLRNKSQKKELIICLPKRIDKISEFENQGADIIEYATDTEYTPSSRFTITNFGRNDARIAVGKALSFNKHLIEEFGNGEHPYFYVAHDLVNLAKQYTKSQDVK